MTARNTVYVGLLGSVIALYIGYVCYSKPSYNWDTLPYMALILNIEIDDLQEVHKKTYEISEHEIPLQEYKWMVDTTHLVRKELMKDHKKFFQFTSFFRVKPAYVWLSYFVYKAGIPLSKAPVLISIVSFIVIFWILLLWLAKNFDGVMPSILSLCIIISPPVLEAARLATPDMLSTAFLLATCYLMLFGNNWAPVVLMITISILVRVDNVFFGIILFTVYLLFSPPKNMTINRVPLIVIVNLIWIFMSAAILYWSNFQNGLSVFYGGLFEMNPLKKMTAAINGLKTIQNSHLILILLMAYLAVFYKKEKSIRALTNNQILLMGLIIYVVIKFIVFPDLTTRFYLSVYLVSIVFVTEAGGTTYLANSNKQLS